MYELRVPSKGCSVSLRGIDYCNSGIVGAFKTEGGLRPPDSRGRLSPHSPQVIPPVAGGFLSPASGFAEKLLILDELAVQFQGFVGRWMPAQNHVAHVHRIRQGCVFRQFFERGLGIVVIHIISSSNHRAIESE